MLTSDNMAQSRIIRLWKANYEKLEKIDVNINEAISKILAKSDNKSDNKPVNAEVIWLKKKIDECIDGVNNVDSRVEVIEKKVGLK